MEAEVAEEVDSSLEVHPELLLLQLDPLLDKLLLSNLLLSNLLQEEDSSEEVVLDRPL